jgi:hypothetical protein
MNSNFIDFNNFNKEQMNDFLSLVKENSEKNNNIIHPAAKFFKENGWVKIEGFLDKNMSNILYHYVTLAAKRCNFLNETFGKNYEQDVFGTFEDPQAPGDYSQYGDLIFDTILNISLENMNILTNKKLVPTYSYYRLYTTGTELTRHRDRASCEISTTLCLGYDTSNISKNLYPNFNWPMFVADKNNEKNGVPVYMKPGDMLIYRGCEIDHWREPFKGLNHAQVFLHYNEIGKENNNVYDNRPVLGLPSKFKKDDVVNISKPLNVELDPEDEAFYNNKNVSVID